MKILVCNAGSTSLKFKLFDMPEARVLAESRIERVGSPDRASFRFSGGGAAVEKTGVGIAGYTEGIELFLNTLLQSGALTDLSEIGRVGFKTVLAKGFYGTHELTEEVLQAMRDYMVVAPAHNGPYLEAIAAVRAFLPDTPFVGAFETAFHTTIPLERRLYGVPYEWYERYGVEKHGYHGASHAFVSAAVARARGGGTGRLISCHLGGSASLCAVLDGRSVDTSFGLSLQTGLIQSNRVGDLDSFVIPYMMSLGFSPEKIETALRTQGGLLGISGVSNDLRDIEEAMAAGNGRAKLAFDVFVTGIVRYIGSYYAELGGLDALAFAGGIGENSARLRAEVCRRIRHLGVVLDEEKNSSASESVISAEGSPVTVMIVKTDEERIVAEKAYGCQIQTRQALHAIDTDLPV